ncbi:hypothetical protein [Nakamurella sp. PAMC28650]|uniref:hypothetical protein n=1 Tax=Nakamurella sp. PAMC28650 TaxID=2762325 RepID=UPI00164E6E83|nr:hypothetical protein [Nakamurella sp. PAMC28650]QNK82595.1 hypothetical protein H7F38_07775 [Nakamurella sp. PAMC28650]
MNPNYETKQAILEEAGLSQIVNGEVLAGVIDGTNLVFNTIYKPITDSNDDDQIDTTDITVYVNGVPVFVQLLNELTGTITLKTAPAAGTVATCDYRYSPVTDAYMNKIREEAEDWINSAMDSIDPVPYGSGVPSTNTVVPPTVRKLTRWYAAAQLLMKDYGFNHDTNMTSKDGASKMALLEGSGEPGKPGYKPGLLNKYIAIGGMSGISDVSAAELDTYAEPDLFSTVDATSGLTVSVDDNFMRDIYQEQLEDGLIP